jgi:hypothetical protein
VEIHTVVLGTGIGLSIHGFFRLALAVAHFSHDCEKRNDQDRYDRNPIYYH